MPPPPFIDILEPQDELPLLHTPFCSILKVVGDSFFLIQQSGPAKAQINSPGYHNLSVANHNMPDPSLTELGEKQCELLLQSFPYHESVDLLVASPLRRTIDTTLLSFQPELEKGMRVIALPIAQETSDMPCDTGSAPDILVKEMRDKPVDLSLVHEGWNSKAGKWAPDKASLENRAKETRQWLKARPEKEIVLVTHGGFLHFLTEDWSDVEKWFGTGWENTELRSYTLIEDQSNNVSLQETPESRARRHGT